MLLWNTGGGGGGKLKVTGSKKVLGVVLDSLLNFKDHIQEKTQAGFAALRSQDFVVGPVSLYETVQGPGTAYN